MKRKHKNKGLIPDRMIVCRDCGIEKHSKEYKWRVKDSATYKTLDTNQCKDCRSKHSAIIFQLKKKHKYPDNSICECCGKVKKLALDHEHTNYEFRGWLCSKCNVGMGNLGDTIDGLQKAIDYLKKRI
jgi:hypothetical protein